MKKILLMVVLLLSISCSTFAAELTGFAAELTGTDLLQGCNSLIKALEGNNLTQDDNNNIHFWSGYLEGFLDTMPAAGTVPYCLPEKGLSYGQLAMTIRKYLNNNPEFLDKEPAALILLALAKTFPCDKQGVKQIGK